MSDPVLEITFDATIDEASHDELVEAGAGFPEKVNVRRDQRGGDTKRLGFLPRSLDRLGAADRANGNRLFSYDGCAHVIDGTHLDSYIEGLGASVVRGRVPEAKYSLHGFPMPRSADTVVDAACAGGYVAIGYQSTVGASAYPWVSLLEEGSFAVVLPPEQLGSAVSAPVRLASFSSRYIVAFTLTTGTSTLVAYILDTQAIASGWSTLATVTTSAVNVYAACSMSNRVAIAYTTNSGTDRLTVKTYNQTGLLETRTIGTSSTTPGRVDINGSIAGTLWVAWAQGSDTWVCGLDGDALATTLATSAQIITGAGSNNVVICEGASGKARVAGVGGALVTMRGVQTTLGAAATDGPATTVRAAYWMGRPFYEGGRYYMPVHGPDLSNLQSVGVLVDWTDDVAWFRPVANVEPGLVYAFTGAYPPGIPRDSAGRRVWPLAVFKSGTSFLNVAGDEGVVIGGLAVQLDFSARDRWMSATHAGLQYLSGPVLSVFDGDRVTESGFLIRPPQPTASSSGAGSTDGTVRYVAVYEDVDRTGNRVVSGISVPSQPFAATTDTVAVTVEPLTISSRVDRGTVIVSFYRTEAGGAPPYYYVGSSANDLTAAVTFSDSTDDGDLTANRTLYAPSLAGIDGGGQDRRAPPGLNRIVAFNDMLVGAKGPDVWFTAQTVYGEAPWHSPIFQIQTTSGGDVEALEAQDGSLYIFKRDQIYAVSGEAPSDNGQTGGLGLPRRLAVNVGSIDGMTLVTELGIFFRSARGIELLSRGGGVVWIGEKIQRTLESFPYVTSMVLDDGADLVRITLVASVANGRAGSDSEGRTLVFDITGRGWVSTDEITGDATLDAAQDAAVVVHGGERRYAWLDPNGTVWVEKSDDDEDAHLDDAVWIRQCVVTPWVHIAGLNGEQFVDQVLLIARRHTSHDLTISLAYDFADTYAASKTFTAANIDALAREWLNREVTQTTSQAVRVKLEDATPSSGDVDSGKGSSWIALTFNGQPHRGPKRTSGAQRGGT